MRLEKAVGKTSFILKYCRGKFVSSTSFTLGKAMILSLKKSNNVIVIAILFCS